MDEQEFATALEFARSRRTEHFVPDAEAPRFGRAEELNEAERERLEESIRLFAPWRKGPFQLFGRRIEANWKSQEKWNRILPYLGDLQGKDVADVGCNNGYYLFRLLGAGAGSVMGLDPVAAFARAFQFLDAFHPSPEIRFVQQGYEALADFPKSFDLILCLGIIYHHPDPVSIFRLCHGALRTGGMLVVESLGLPENPSREADFPGGWSLIPEGRYAGMKGIHHVPDARTVRNWLRRAGFRDCDFRDEHDFTTHQQRTELADMPTLADGLDPNNPERTVEGYPAPVRLIHTARR